MAKELSRHASVIMYLGIRYEYVLANRFRAKGDNLRKLVKSAGRAIPQELRYRLMRLNVIRNVCAHDIGFKKLDNLSEAIAMLNEIEDGFAKILSNFQPEYLTESDFDQPSNPATDVMVVIPSKNTVYIHEVVIPRIVKIGLALLAIALLLTLIFGFMSKSESDYSTGGVWGIGATQHQDTYNNPTGAVWCVVGAAFITVGGWAWYAISTKLRNRSKKL
jgi:hypothetical protein